MTARSSTERVATAGEAGLADRGLRRGGLGACKEGREGALNTAGSGGGRGLLACEKKI